MATHKPTPAQAAQLLAEAHRQRAQLVADGAVPRWRIVLLSSLAATAIIGIGLARDLLDRTLADLVSLGALVVLILIIAVIALSGYHVGARLLRSPALPLAPLRQRVMNVALTAVALLPGIAIWSFVMPALNLPLPNTSAMVFWVSYTAMMVVTLRRWLSRHHAGSKK